MSAVEIVNRLLEADASVKDFILAQPSVELLDKDRHAPCGEKCQICRQNPCTLIHPHDAGPQHRAGMRYRHMCQACDVAQFDRMLDEM